jgi:valacyclovir hydrolase
LPWFEHGASRIYYEETGSGDPVLLLPGLTGRIDRHQLLRDALARHYRVIAAELPGSGRSGPQPRNYRPGFYDEDAQALVAFLAERGAVPSRLIGFSDGGEVALVMAAISPQIARAVLTWGAAGTIRDPGGRIAAFFRNIVDDPPADASDYQEYLVASYGEGIARATTRNFANVIDAMVAAGGDIVSTRAGQITCPVLMMVGETDFFASKAQIDGLAGQMTNAATIEVESAGHVIHEDRPQWLVDTVMEWLITH